MKKSVLIIILVLAILVGLLIFLFSSTFWENGKSQTYYQQSHQQENVSNSNKNNLDKVVSEFPDSAGSGFPKDIFG